MTTALRSPATPAAPLRRRLGIRVDHVHVAAALGGLERDAAWRPLCACDPALAGLERRAGRRYPIVRLEPIAGAA